MVSTDPEPALSGVRWSGTQEGTLGVSVRGKVPIMADDGTVIGMVWVGFLQAEVEHLADGGSVEITMQYGAPGRPEHRYRLSAPPRV